MSAAGDPLQSSAVEEGETHASSHRRLCCPPALSKRYKNTCVTTKGAFVALLWSALMSGLVSLFLLVAGESALPGQDLYDIIWVQYFMYIFPFLLYPVAALVGELRWTRYKSLLLGSVIVLIGGLLSTIFSYDQLSNMRNPLLSVLAFQLFTLHIPSLVVMLGSALFQSNVIQYGTEQLDFASSEVLSSFVFWYYWTCYLLPGVELIAVIPHDFVYLSMALVTALVPIDLYALLSCVIFSIVAVLILALMCITICCCCWNPELRMNQGHGVNPVKLVWKVMQFARKNKHPPLRSAFTYSEMPSRLDLAKQRYGGPFTTWEVEDVKSFWRILLVLVALIGFQFRDQTTYTTIIRSYLCTISPSVEIAVASTLKAFVIIVYVPVHQLLFRPHFFRYIPSMLTRMKLGLLIAFASLLITTAYSMLVSQAETYVNITFSPILNNDCVQSESYNVSLNFIFCPQYTIDHTYYQLLHINASNCEIIHIEKLAKAPPVAMNLFWIKIPQVLNGLAELLVFLTALEFILAQAPRAMKGFLIGLWYSMESIHLGITAMTNLTCIGYHWEYYAGKTLLMLLSFVFFLCVARRYKYRQLNEDVDVNIQQVIEDVFERNFDREERFYQKQLQDAQDCLVKKGDH